MTLPGRAGGRIFLAQNGALLFCVAFSFLLVSPIFLAPFHFADNYDWRYFETTIEVSRRSVLWWHQFPLWNPYLCGGEVLLANPQSVIFSPSFLLMLAAGTALGLKLNLWLYFFCATDGMFRLARQQGADQISALFAAALYGSCGWLVLHLSVGHQTFSTAALFPYLLYCYLRSLDQSYWTIPLGLAAAWIVGLGGTFTPGAASLLLGGAALFDTIRTRSITPFRNLLFAALVALLVGAVRILPALEFAIMHPRPMKETDSSTFFDLVRGGFAWLGAVSIAGKRYRFHEYSWRLPYIAAPFWLGSILIPSVRRWWWLMLLGAGLAVGAAIPYGPWWLTKQLPILRDLRVPSRYLIFVALAAALLSGLALHHFKAKWGSHQKLFAAACLIVAVIDGAAFSLMQFRRVFGLPLPLASADSKFFQVRGHWSQMMNLVFLNRGVIGCDEEAPLQRAAQLDEGDVAQVRLDQPEKGKILHSQWTPGLMTVELESTEPVVLLFNQNWNEHWTMREYTQTGERSLPAIRYGAKWPADVDGGRLATVVPAGHRTIVARYRPKSFIVGGVASTLALPAALGLWWWLRRRRLALA